MSAKSSHHRSTSKSAHSRRAVAAHRKPGRQAGVSAVVVLFGVLVLVIGVIGYLLTQMNKFKSGRTGEEMMAEEVGGVSPTKKMGGLAALFAKKPAVTPAPSPTPILEVTMAPRPLPKGEQEYTVSTGDSFTGPKFTRVIVSDFATPMNKPQTVTVYITKATAATKVSGVLATDTKKTPFAMTQQKDEGDQQVWKGEWVLNDTVEKNFVLQFSAEGAAGHSEFAVTAR
jgi:hypothetical protein